MDKLLNEIFEDLKIELNLTEESSQLVLFYKIKNAIKEVKKMRNYQPHHTDLFIWNDMSTYYSNIRELALYDYNQYGAEGEISHSEIGISRSWKDRKECLSSIRSFCSVI